MYVCVPHSYVFLGNRSVHHIECYFHLATLKVLCSKHNSKFYYFEQLFSIDQITRPPINDNDTFANQPDVTELNEPISREEIIVAVERVKLRKAAWLRRNTC
jgi:hypothetical protein